MTCKLGYHICMIQNYTIVIAKLIGIFYDNKRHLVELPERNTEIWSKPDIESWWNERMTHTKCHSFKQGVDTWLNVVIISCTQQIKSQCISPLQSCEAKDNLIFFCLIIILV